MAGAAKNLFPVGLRRWVFNMSGYNKYGLMTDDLLYENDDVKEALRRLPPHLVDDRNFRILRAFQLSIQKIYLPKENWVKFEEDNRYLKPYLEEVKKEREEKENWRNVA